MARVLFIAIGVISTLFVSNIFLSPTANTSQEQALIYSHVPEANTLFLQAHDALSKGTPWLGGSLSHAREVIRLLEQAIQKDPQLVEAYLDLASAWQAFNYSVADGLSPKEIMPKAKAAALKAAALDPTSARARLHLAGIAYNYDYAWDTADREYSAALQQSPDDAVVHMAYAWFLGLMGRFEAALGAVQKAKQLDPSLWWADMTALLIHYWKRDYETAAEYDRLVQGHTDSVSAYFFRGMLAVARQRYDEAIAQLKQSIATVDNGGSRAALAYAYAMADKHSLAREILNKLETGLQEKIVAYRLGAVYLALGDRDAAVEWLRKSYQARDNWMAYLKVDPVMDPLRSDPRFQELSRLMQFPE